MRLAHILEMATSTYPLGSAYPYSYREIKSYPFKTILARGYGIVLIPVPAWVKKPSGNPHPIRYLLKS